MVVCIATYGTYEWYVQGDLCRIHALTVPGVEDAVHHHSATATWAYSMARAIERANSDKIVIVRAEERLPHDYEWID